MLTGEQLEQLFAEKHLSEQGREVVRAIRNSPPRRRVNTSSRSKNIPCRFPSKKMNRVIQAESKTVELSAIYLMEHDDTVFEFWDQPIHPLDLIYRSSGGKKVRVLSTADFLVISRSFIGFVEWKAEEALKGLVNEKPGRFCYDTLQKRYRCPPAEAYTESIGLGFQLRVSSEINQLLVRNLILLHEYFSDKKQYEVGSTLNRWLHQVYKSQSFVLLSDLIDGNPVGSADAILGAIACGRLFVDLGQDLVENSTKCRVFESEEAHRIFKQLVPAPGASEREPSQIPSEIMSASPAALAEARSKYAAVSRVLKGGEDSKTVSMAENIPYRTLAHWLRLYRRAEKERGEGFIGLIPQKHKRGNRKSKLPERVFEIMDRAVEDHYLGPKRKNAHSVYGVVVDRCISAGLTPPSTATFYGRLQKLDSVATTAAREGEKAAYQQSAYDDVQTDHWRSGKRSVRAFELCHVDHTEMDIELISYPFGVNLGRPWLSVVFDDYSECILGYYITYDPPSYRSVMSCIRDVVKRHNHMPENLVVDGGKDFESIYFETLCARYGCTIQRRTGKPRYGSEIERYFGISKTEFVTTLAGNTQATRQVRQLTSQINPKRLALWSLPNLYERFDAYVNLYHRQKNKETGLSRSDSLSVNLSQLGERAGRKIEYNLNFIITTLPTTRKGYVTVKTNRSVQVRNVDYWHSAFRNSSLDHTKAPVRYDPFDQGYIYVLLQNEWLRCQAVNYSAFHGRTEKEVQLATAEIVRKKSLHRKSYKIRQAELARFMESNELIEVQLLKDKESAQVRSRMEPNDIPAVETEKDEGAESDWNRKQAVISQSLFIDLNDRIPEDF